MLDTLMTGHEPFYADYPSYQETEPLTHPHHQTPHQHAIPRNTGMPPVSLDATTHTPGTLLPPPLPFKRLQVTLPSFSISDISARNQRYPRKEEPRSFVRLFRLVDVR